MSEHPFDYFVVLAGMRTGSNLLEEQLSAMPGLETHGELFNPHFFGRPDVSSKWDLTLKDRDADPIRTIERMKQRADGLPGFRLFFDHNKRALDHVLADRRAAKVILKRRPIDSYVSLKIARKTGQWWLGDMTSARVAKVQFVAEEYADFLNDLNAFQNTVTRALQTTGQTGFHVSYDDLSDNEVIAGLGGFLGANGAPKPSQIRAKVQNPTSVDQRLSNLRVAEEALSRISAPDLEYLTSYEPDRGPGLRYFRVGKTVPLLYMPIRGAWNDPIPEWMKSIDPGNSVESGLTQRELRRWKRLHPGHRSFTVLRHPLPRVHDAFCRFVLPTDAEGFEDIRSALINRYDLPLPKDPHSEDYDLSQHRECFLRFLKFLAGNLGGQTSLRVDNSWATQHVLLHAIGEFAMPDRVVRAENLNDHALQVAKEVGFDAPELTPDTGATTLFALSDVVTADIQEACEQAYRRDYLMFGFEDWSPPDS